MRKFLYLISPNKIKTSFYLDLEEVLSSNKVMFFQLRLKDYSASKILNIGKKIRKITKKYKVKFLINDSFKIAKNVNADGCHIGQSDGTINSARDILKKKLLVLHAMVQKD